ncbi:hypothetical protein D9758_009080 [Tetrapyrgos nigripes]|uniref:Uncharacterized protein n=1 Tax=Tetrapyrgos nigripes TaxID=182062 RepID=A0A8H5G9W8_9AGAR|nr:hypothetical protein D9758_009080 [Tetrapyrgos nigripes]
MASTGLRATLTPQLIHIPRSPTATITSSTDVDSPVVVNFEDAEDSGNDNHLPAFSEIDEPPPNFAPYRAEWERVDYEENIVSHDSHLNTDPEALYRFLLQQSATPPKVYINCKGTHFEYGSEHGHGTVTDFDFLVSLNDYLECKVTHWTVADDEPAYRGRDVLEVEEKGWSGSGSWWRRREASRSEKRLWRSMWSRRIRQGLPPWVVKGSGVEDVSGIPQQFHSAEALRSSKSIRQWAEDYCAYEDALKEFCYRKVVYGWDLDFISQSIHRAICIKGSKKVDVQVNVVYRDNRVSVKPDNRYSRALSNPSMRDLLTVTLVYPVILACKRFGAKLGARWEVCGGGYRLARDHLNEQGWVEEWVPKILQEVQRGNRSRRPI